MIEHETNSAQSELHKLLKWLSFDKNIHMSVHDLTGSFQDDRILSLPSGLRIHSCSFCTAAKMTSWGLAKCLRNKKSSINNAANNDGYTGRCYLGITEIVKPVKLEDTLFCILYLGNISVSEVLPDTKRRIHRACLSTGVSETLLLQELDCMEKLPEVKLAEYQELADLAASYIELYIKSIGMRQLLKQREDSALHHVVRQAMDYIDRFYYTDLSLSEIAGLYFINEQYLSKLFSRQTGLSYSTYVNRTRIRRAVELLHDTDRKIIDIASAVGFNNVSYFNRVFKGYTGWAPKEFRAGSDRAGPPK